LYWLDLAATIQIRGRTPIFHNINRKRYKWLRINS